MNNLQELIKGYKKKIAQQEQTIKDKDNLIKQLKKMIENIENKVYKNN